MKKIYLKPTLDIVNVNIDKLLSGGSLSGDYVKEGNAGTGENLSRKGGFWDEEDDE